MNLLALARTHLSPPTGPFCTASNLSPQPESPLPSPGSSLVCLPDLPTHIFSPSNQIQPGSHIQYPGQVWSPLPTLQPITRLLSGPPQICPSHTTSKLSSQPGLPPHSRLGTGGTNCTLVHLLYLPDFIPPKTFPTSRPNPPKHPLFLPNLLCPH